MASTYNDHSDLRPADVKAAEFNFQEKNDEQFNGLDLGYT